MSLKDNLIFKRLGEKAILIEWNSEVQPSLIDEITSFKNEILDKKIDQIQDFIIGYTSLVIKYKEEIIGFSDEIVALQKIYSEKEEVRKETKFIWEIPVCYHVDFGFDLPEMSKQLNVSIKELIDIHSTTLYTVHFIGFLPGFLYLGGLNTKLFIQRKATPLLKVPKGAVAIGGKQTGIYPEESAGGWQIIGKTPINFFNANKTIPCFAKAGDKIRFKSITKEEFISLAQSISEGSYELHKTEWYA
ncbi:5-oxoprolinase subunit PxpB [Tenacibaculum sp. ZS6-P6]|uniref:5-oxoprolinase subunit PxpB n=1 Tax=Tenacibaculum sp. ZS6-P6 TaxID=3447503 RepID=UPI003F9D1E53